MGPTHPLLHWVPRALSPALKLVEREADYSLPRVRMSGVITLLFLAPPLRTQEVLEVHIRYKSLPDVLVQWLELLLHAEICVTID